MNVLLMFEDVVQRALLDRRTAAHVLQNAHHAPGLPTMGPKGLDRHFTLREAMRLAICAHLVKRDFSLLRSAWIVSYCESFLTKLTGEVNGRLSFASDRDAPWILRIVDGLYVQLWRDDLHQICTFWRASDYINMYSQQVRRRIVGLSRYELNMTRLESRLAHRF